MQAANSLGFNLEPTFRCNLSCEMCPRFSSIDPYLDMSFETYERIADFFHLAHTVDFTGWGEPLLHPRIYEMIRRASDAGCVATMTSNGTVLNARNSAQLIESGMHNLTVSIDGLTAPTFEAIRPGASFAAVTENLKELSRQVEAAAADLDLGIAFTLQEDNLEEMALLVDFALDVGAKVVHLKQLNVISTQEDWGRSFLKYRLSADGHNGSRMARAEQALSETRDAAMGAGLRVLVHSELPMRSELKPRHCLAAPLDAVYFSYEGRVAPCCYFGHQVSNYFDGVQYPPSSLFYGDIREQSFTDIWMSEPFTSFRAGFTSGHYPEECQTCYLLYGK